MRTFTRWMGMGLVAAALMVSGCRDRSRESGQHNQGATGGSGSGGSMGSQEGTGGSGSMQGSDAGTAH